MNHQSTTTSQSNQRLENLQALGFSSELEYHDHQQTIQASKQLGAQQLQDSVAAGLIHCDQTFAKSPICVQHVIGYAYPGSTMAAKLGHSKTGCFTVEVARKTTPAKTYSEAKANVVRLGTVPGRWSWDHPSNSHLKMH